MLVSGSIADIALNVEAIGNKIFSMILMLAVVVIVIVMFMAWWFTNPLNSAIAVIKKWQTVILTRE